VADFAQPEVQQKEYHARKTGIRMPANLSRFCGSAMQSVRMSKLIAPFAACMMLTSMPAQAATCAEGLIMLDKTLRKLKLNDDEFSTVSDMMFKAKVEADRGNTQQCVYIVGDIIRLVFLQGNQAAAR
jgi:hypothetical protein